MLALFRYKLQKVVDYIPYNGNRCQLMILLSDHFNKRAEFRMITISGLCPFLNLTLEVTCFITCNFEKLILYVLLVGIKVIGSFFLATILVMQNV